MEVCILLIGHSRARARASYPCCLTPYPREFRLTRVVLKTVHTMLFGKGR